MRHFSKKISIVALLAVMAVSFSSAAFAGDGENSVTGFFRRLFKFPVKTAEKTGEVTANTLQNTGEAVSNVGENTAQVVTGDLGNAPNLAGQAVADTANTVGQTAAETVQIPGNAVEATNTTT